MATKDPVHLDGNAAEELASILRGELVRSGDVNYEQHRKVWNGSIDRFPTLIARCAGRRTIAAVRFARAHGLLVAVRGGGHSFPGHSVCDGGMVIDLPDEGDPGGPCGPNGPSPGWRPPRGADHETQAFGLIVPAGLFHTILAGSRWREVTGSPAAGVWLTIDNLPRWI